MCLRPVARTRTPNSNSGFVSLQQPQIRMNEVSQNTVPTPWHIGDDDKRRKTRPEGIEPPSFRLEGGCLIR